MISATKPEMGPYDAYIDEIRDIWDTGIMTNNGPKVQKFREKLIERIGCKNAELFVNGHSASMIALKALELPAGGEVLTSPFTFVSTTNAIVQNNLTPVFCDIDSTYNIDIESIKRNITDKTCAIFVPHIFGIPCHVQEIEEIDGTDIGCFGDITMFSFHAIKVFNSIEGGLLTFKDERLKEKFELYRNFGICYGETNDVGVAGYNAKMNEFQAAMGLVNIRLVDKVIEKRKELAELYINLIAEIPGVETYHYEKNIAYNFAYFPVIINADVYGKTRDELWNALKAAGIGTRKLYDTLTCDFSVFRSSNYRKDTAFAEKVTEKCLDLPMYSSMRPKDVEMIGNKLMQIKKRLKMNYIF